MRKLFDVLTKDPLHIKYLEGRSGTLVVSFAGVGTKPSLSPPPEFYKIASDGGLNHVLFVSDLSRSWMNAPHMRVRIQKTVELISEMIGAERVVAIGNSMGASMALWMADHVHFDTVTAFVPQVSVHPEIVPEEHRWMRFRKRIETYRFKQIERLNAPETQYFVFHGDTEDERVHAQRFPAISNGRHYILPKHDHNLARALRGSGDLPSLMFHAMAGHQRRVHLRMTALGAQQIADYATFGKQRAG